MNFDLARPYRKLILTDLRRPVPSGDESVAALESRLMAATSNNVTWLRLGGAHGPHFNITGFEIEGDDNNQYTTYTPMPEIH